MKATDDTAPPPEVTIELDCGIVRQRLVDWLDSELALEFADGRWVFRHGKRACRIEVRPLEKRVLGAVGLERTLVRMQGERAAVQELERLFTLRFASAGG